VNKRKREDEKLLKQNRPKVLERDNYSCVLCGGHEGIAIHHIELAYVFIATYQ